ncbi:MAG: IS630 family transposase [Kiritimatiellae bacterium]|nr:IS630 family transposase [Kiritimatiellia bacterium]
MKKKPGRPVEPVLLTDDERTELERRVKASKTSKRDSERAEIILLRASGMRQEDVANQLECSSLKVSKWTARFRRDGLGGLEDKAGRGRKPSLAPERIEKVITQVSKPPKGRERWSTRSMAKAARISHSSVQRLWHANDLKPHRTEVFKVSNDPHFEEKFWDVIGLYLNPPDRALVLCCDEKSQCQALERTQRALPLSDGHGKTITHDYIRHGTITLFAALDYLEGKVFSRLDEKHTHVEWLRFMKQIHRECPRDLTLHIILDNYATHKKQEVRDWIERRNRQQQKQNGINRIELHFTPTSSSWMNLIERFFGDISQQAICNGSFSSVRELARRIEDYISEHNLDPKRYIWKAEGQEILAKIQRAKEKLAAV